MLQNNVQGNEFLYTSIYESQDTEALRHYLDFFGFDNVNAYLYICIEVVTRIGKRSVLADKVRSFLEDKRPCVTGLLKDRLFSHEHIVAFIPVKRLESEQDNHAKKEFIQEIYNSIKDDLKIEVKIGVGKTCVDMDKTADAYQSALSSLKNTTSTNRVVFPDIFLAGSEIVVERAKMYINSHLAEDISLEQVSEAVDVSVFYLSRIFSHHAGVSFVDYISTQRVSRAKGLLKFSRLSINKISRQCGFTDQNYFTKVFRKITGITPSQYRKSLRD